jgi:DNA-binding NarL/FixJ family response regulator
VAFLAFSPTEQPLDDIGILTPRKDAVMHKALLGQSNKEIASALIIAEQTVKSTYSTFTARCTCMGAWNCC